VFHMVLTANSHIVPKQHSLVDLCSGGVFPTRYEIHFYISFKRNSVFIGLTGIIIYEYPRLTCTVHNPENVKNYLPNNVQFTESFTN
jgi:hypothetical protein